VARHEPPTQDPVTFPPAIPAYHFHLTASDGRHSYFRYYTFRDAHVRAVRNGNRPVYYTDASGRVHVCEPIGELE